MNTWQHMRSLITYRPGLFILNVVVWGVFHSAPLLAALMVQQIFDALSGSALAGWNAWTFLALLAAAYAFRAGVFIAGLQAFFRIFLMAQALVRRNLLDHLVQAAGSRISPESPSEAVTQFRDDVDDITRLFEQILDFAGILVYTVGALMLLMLTDPLITLVACGPMFLMAFIVRRLSPIIRSYRRRHREATALVTGFIGESFSSVLAVKAAGKEDAMTRHFAQLGENRRRAALKDTLLTEVIRSINSNLVNVGMGVVLIMAADSMLSGTFTVGDFALFVQLLPRITNALTFTGDIMAQYRRTGVAIERLSRLLQDSPAEKITEHAPLYLDGKLPALAATETSYTPLEVLEVKGLSFTYPNSEAGIQDISFTVRRGEFVVITGRIGAGKSTTLRVLQGLLPRNSGEIFWNGVPIDDPATFFRPPHSAYTAQAPRLFSETLRNNILLGDDKETELPQALDLAVMTPDVAQLEHGLDTLVGNRGVKLSGGQVQRASAARMFLRDADLLIFDDLSSALDVQTEQALWEGLFARRDATCLVVSHRRIALQRADRIIVLRDGKVADTGTLGELLERSSDLRELWSQAEEDTQAVPEAKEIANTRT